MVGISGIIWYSVLGAESDHKSALFPTVITLQFSTVLYIPILYTVRKYLIQSIYSTVRLLYIIRKYLTFYLLYIYYYTLLCKKISYNPCSTLLSVYSIECKQITYCPSYCTSYCICTYVYCIIFTAITYLIAQPIYCIFTYMYSALLYRYTRFLYSGKCSFHS